MPRENPQQTTTDQPQGGDMGNQGQAQQGGGTQNAPTTSGGPQGAGAQTDSTSQGANNSQKD